MVLLCHSKLCRYKEAIADVVVLLSSLADHPPAPILTITSNAFSLDLQWTLPDNSFVREYRLTYVYTGPCPEGVEGVAGEGNITVSRLERGYIIEGLLANSGYAGTLVAVNDRGVSNATHFNTTTATAGKDHSHQMPRMIPTPPPQRVKPHPQCINPRPRWVKPCPQSCSASEPCPQS